MSASNQSDTAQAEPASPATETDDANGSNGANDFAMQAEAANEGIVREFVGFLKENKRWWLIPIIITLALLGFMLFLGGGPLAPFIYTLF